MSCPICDRSACAVWVHSLEEQEANRSVIEAAERLAEERRRAREGRES